MLPSYDAMADALAMRGWKAGMIPQKKSTRKGLARYAAQSVLASRDPRNPYWWQLWWAAREARLLMRWLSVQLPADTFDGWRLQVRLRLQDPEVRKAHPDGEKAYKWASR
jgi:hypothetical protein